jgi:acyl-CoA synthetase (NDP forming)
MIESGTTRVVIGFMEGFRDLPRMKRLALDAAGKQIPIILIKVGRSEKGIQAARSHTGALAGDAGVMEGFFRQYGIIHVETIEELVETAGIFSRCPLPQGPRVGISTFSGGLAGLYADLCARLSIDLPDLSPNTTEALKATLPDFAQPANPLDVTGSGFASGMDKVVKILLEDENIDILIPVSFPPSSKMDTWADGFNQSFLPMLHTAGKPVIPITFREVSDYARQYYRDHEAYFIDHVEDGFKAVSHLIRYAQFLRRLNNK